MRQCDVTINSIISLSDYCKENNLGYLYDFHFFVELLTNFLSKGNALSTKILRKEKFKRPINLAETP